jgi:spore coat protein U-like protein
MKKNFCFSIKKSPNESPLIRTRCSLYGTYPEKHQQPVVHSDGLSVTEAGQTLTGLFRKSLEPRPADRPSKNPVDLPISLGSALLSAALLLLTPPPAHALGLDCNVSSTGVAYGVYDPNSSSPTNATGNVHVSCTVLLASVLSQINIRLSTGSSGTFANRKMSGGADQLNYNLYKDASHTTVWGDGTGGTGIFTDNLLIAVLGTSVDHTIYGSIPPGQYVAAGSYADTITVTVEFHEGI